MRSMLMSYALARGLVHKITDLLALYDCPEASSAPVPECLRLGVYLL